MMKIYSWISLLALITACSISKDWTASTTTLTEGIHDIAVIDDNTAVAYSYGTGNMYKTLNGGKDWTQLYQFDSIYFEQIQFLDAHNGWLIGGPNKIYHTQDGGKSWTDKALDKAFDQTYLYGMHFEDIDTGYVAALGRGKQGFTTKIFQTKDSGETWEMLNELSEMILNLERINGILYASGDHVILKNVEDSENWSYVFQDTSKQVGQIRDLEQDGATIYAASFNGYIIKVHEQASKIQQITSNRIRSLTFANATDWIAVGDNNEEAGNLFRSSDKGANWRLSEQQFPDIHRIEKGKKTLWIVGKEGLMMRRGI